MKIDERHPGRLLVVDDNEGNRDMLSRRLSKSGFTVESVSNGPDALERVERGELDLILLDVMMPGMSGLEVLKVLREQHSASELPVIMATANSKSEDIVEALELGANDYVTKPIDFPVVLARIGLQLRQKTASKADASADIGPGVTLEDKYLLVESLGSGNFGVVYKATHLDLKQDVAVKILHTNGGTSPEALARFRREGVSTCRVKHPNAVSVLDFGMTSSGTAYLVMELLDGCSLDVLLGEDQRLDVERCAEILRPICDVLADIHNAGLVHRDIKPANVFVHRGRSGELVKVLDFGIAKLVGDASSEEGLTVEGGIIGTPSYMAPERFEEKPYDGRADIYSVGVMLYRMLGGRLPFLGKELMAVAMQHLREIPPPLSELNPAVSSEVASVVAEAMSKDFTERPGAAELLKRFGRSMRRRSSDA
jgi:serine/threonine protein kinase